MKQVLLLGAGKSSAHLIRHLITHTESLHIGFCIVDIHIDHIPADWVDHRVCLVKISPEDSNPFEQYIAKSDIVISMLPASFHIQIARYCLQYSKHLITPSYISDEMRAMDKEAKSKGLIFLNEMGFDPGIDHMTTMKLYHSIVDKGGKLISYRSYAGGLVAPKDDDNPWNYKFSWNPRNVILAGQGGEILYKRNGMIENLSYHQLFEHYESVSIQNHLTFDAYANRDSLKYEKLYGWSSIDTLMRGTLRKKGFCSAWDFMISLGLTDDTMSIDLGNDASYFDFYSYFYQLPWSDSIRDDFYSKYQIQDKEDLKVKLDFIGFFDHTTKLPCTQGTAAQIFQSILEPKWKLKPTDTDWVVMVHFLDYVVDSKCYRIESSLSLEGEDATYTAMSKTVGMPIAYATELILSDMITERGVLLPTSEEIYSPILGKLEGVGVVFHESEIEL